MYILLAIKVYINIDACKTILSLFNDFAPNLDRCILRFKYWVR